MKIKTDNCIIWLIVVFILGLLFASFGMAIVKYASEKESDVVVYYKVFGPSGVRNRVANYRMKGKEFTTRTESYRGSNTVEVIDKDAWYCYINNQSEVIYCGTSDIEVDSIVVRE